jgi:hypothetical protein
MPSMSVRLRRRIERDFPEPGSAREIELLVGDGGDSERVQAAIVMWGRGDLDRIRNAQALALQDWRDVLVRAALADDDWRFKLDAELGPQS